MRLGRSALAAQPDRGELLVEPRFERLEPRLEPIERRERAALETRQRRLDARDARAQRGIDDVGVGVDARRRRSRRGFRKRIFGTRHAPQHREHRRRGRAGHAQVPRRKPRGVARRRRERVQPERRASTHRRAPARRRVGGFGGFGERRRGYARVFKLFQLHDHPSEREGCVLVRGGRFGRRDEQTQDERDARHRAELRDALEPTPVRVFVVGRARGLGG